VNKKHVRMITIVVSHWLVDQTRSIQDVVITALDVLRCDAHWCMIVKLNCAYRCWGDVFICKKCEHGYLKHLFEGSVNLRGALIKSIVRSCFGWVSSHIKRSHAYIFVVGILSSSCHIIISFNSLSKELIVAHGESVLIRESHYYNKNNNVILTTFIFITSKHFYTHTRVTVLAP